MNTFTMDNGDKYLIGEDGCLKPITGSRDSVFEQIGKIVDNMECIPSCKYYPDDILDCDEGKVPMCPHEIDKIKAIKSPSGSHTLADTLAELIAMDIEATE